MTTIDLTLRRGDTKVLPFHVTDSDDADISLVGAVVKFSVKRRTTNDQADALIAKTSYDATEVEITEASTGRVSVKIEKSDSIDVHVAADPRVYSWDLEITRPSADDRSGASVGTVAVTAGSGAIVGTGTAFESARVGDLLMFNGSNTENEIPVTITGITDDTHLETDFDGWTTESGLTLTVTIPDVKTPGSGSFTITADVTR